MSLKRLFRAGDPSASTADSAASLYRSVVAQARRPEFYAAFGVPDSVDGRFDMIALHMFVLLHRLKSDPAAAELAQSVFDMMFVDMDRSLREMGVGDLGVGRRVRAMAEGLYGRIAAYEAGLAADDPALAAALRRNLYGTLHDGPSSVALGVLCAYIREAVRGLAAQPMYALASGEARFPRVPEQLT